MILRNEGNQFILQQQGSRLTRSTLERQFFLPFEEPQRLIDHRKTLVDIVRLDWARDGNIRSARCGGLASSACDLLPHDRENSLRTSAIALYHTLELRAPVHRHA